MPVLRCIDCKQTSHVNSAAFPPPCRLCGGKLKFTPKPPRKPKPQREERRPDPNPRATAAEMRRRDNRPIVPQRPPDYRKYITSLAWSKKRRWAIRKVGSRCEQCGATERLQVHHLHYETLGRERLKDLLVLCADCHGIEHENKYTPRDRLSAEFRSIVG